MKEFRFLSSFISILLILTAHLLSAQITRVDFMKVDGNAENYLNIEREWKKIHQKRLEKGLIYAWYFIRKHFAGTTDEYQYVTVTVYPSLAATQNPYPAEVMEGYGSDFMERTSSSRQLIRTEIYDTPVVTEVTHIPKFAYMAFMKVEQGMDDDYLQMETDLWEPAHVSLIKEGLQETWSVYRQLLPGGYSGEYNFVTISGFNDLKKLNFEPPQGWVTLMKTVHPARDPEEILEITHKSRTMVKTELWEVVDKVVPDPGN